MAGRYIPPALRARVGGDGGQKPRSGNDSESGSGSVPSGLRGRGTSRKLTARSDALPDGDLCSAKEIERRFWPDPECWTSGAKQKTLHDSAATPGALSYVLLFKDANPRWPDDGIIFTKSNLELLPAELANKPTENGATGEGGDASFASNGTSHTNNGESERGGQEHEGLKQEDTLVSALPTKSDKPHHLQYQHQQPIAIFTQVRRSQGNSARTFKFAGYYHIVYLSYLQPHSPELVRMLELKWSLTNPRTGQVRQRQRDASAWQGSLNMRWAVIKFERDEEAMKSLGPLKIERVEDEDDEEFESRPGGGSDGGKRRREKKGVNELLRELRMGDEAKKENKQDQDGKETLDGGANGADEEAPCRCLEEERQRPACPMLSDAAKTTRGE
ncbi:uncharacterized protein A1O5_07149 [Cladophialophora psammophila CBS 110553]|uniref:Uncharacterized protein n=1 Tax=Cladophialophora psammophila CBS 110553 TaxID=1182543 RepID=W9WZH2_9EURO|nr:uncharacterized protein A1O5_07149 [Cladophialophora psammophila CBS 110553]EXJ70076.1 hypothetical protein A1O5_07149 [Cladophialophora psammophila CBS 110553]